LLELKGYTAGVERMDGAKAKITIIIEPETFEKGLKRSYELNRKKIDIPGFRKGKVPRRLIEAQFGKEFFYEDAINEVLPEAYDKAVDEHGLNVVDRPEIAVPEADASDGVVVEATVQLKPEAKIEGYKGLEYAPPNLVVTDEDINNVIEGERNKNARFVPVEDRPVQMGDITRIDFEGFVDDEPFEGGKGEDHELIIGGGRFIPGFEEQLIGMNIGENRDINVSFPEEYHAVHLAGKPAVFKVTLNACNIKELPDADDDFAQSVSDFDTLDEYKDDIKAKLSEDKKNSAEHAKEEALAALLAERVEVDVPDVMIETEVNHMVDGFSRNLAGRGMKIEHYLQFMGGTIEGLRESYREMAKRNVRARLALEAIAAAENLTADDNEIDAEITSMAERYNMEIDRLKAAMSPRETKSLGVDIRVQKAMTLVMENAVEADPVPADPINIEE